MGMSAPEASFSRRLAEAKAAAGKAPSYIDDDDDRMPWVTGDQCWNIIPGCDVAKAAAAAGLPMRASVSGSTFEMLTCQHETRTPPPA